MNVERVCRAALLPLWAVWWGGLTFYAAFVVPAGAELFGSIEQGFLTQQATLRLNQLSWCVITLLIVLAIGATRRRRLVRDGDQSARAEKYLWTLAVALATVQIPLNLWHARLGALLDPALRTVVEGANFYGEHRVYLILTTAQWALGLAAPAVWRMGAAQVRSR